ncbi:MAG: hypothetical protein OEY24_05755 [Candidatus Bathyarchaeota archaeon]|nr:hypothetical protein [Candidatus Bathyarchaeota archaeon]MDH5495190.1 hypothetical protein [Candidatus Bathyarchaeota archaeon]
MPEVRLVIPKDLDRALDSLIKAGFAGNKAELARTALTYFLSTVPTQLQKGYDVETAFSPDGRIFQLEYAMESMKRGGTMVGICCNHGIVLAKETPSDEFLILPNPFYRIFKITETIAIAFSGIQQDSLLVLEEAKKQTGILKKENANVDVEALAKGLTLFMQPYAQKKGFRPLAVAMIIGGLDSQNRPRLFMINSAGASQEYRACMEGKGGDETKGVLKGGYKADMSLEEAVILAIKATLRRKKEPKEVLIATLDLKTKEIRELTQKEKQKLWKRIFP